MSNLENKQEIAELERLNCELTRSLRRCRRLLFDYRSQLAANTNLPELLDDERGRQEPEGSYFAKREEREREMSRLATDRRAAAAHLDLAERYEALAVVFGARGPAGRE